MLEIRLLGQFEVRLDGAPVSIPSRAGQSLLAYLALNAGTAHRREMLAGLLWPDATEASARRSLRQALWRVREALQRAYVLADDITIAFDTDAEYWLDTDRLEREDGAEAGPLAEALELYQGDLLPGFYDDWVGPERERLRAVCERKMQALLDRLAAERRWPESAAWAERWIALGGVPEPAYRALMAAHAGLGDQSAVAATFQRCAEALRRELEVEPSAATARLFEALRAAPPGGAPASAPIAAGARHNLPLQLTSFIGREREVGEVRRLLSGPAPEGPGEGWAARPRLLTLTGPAGTGKTRLALEAAGGLLESFAEGAWLVELAPVADPALVLQAVAAALGVREEPGRALDDALPAYLRDKTLLLIVDNCEHLIDACARTVEVLLQASPGIKILATSRESLGIAGETSYRVPSLSFPGPRLGLRPSELAQYEAVRLFVVRALAVQPDFRLTEQNGPAVAQLVARLDGIPLAIELAAARLKALSVEQVAERLSDRFRLLTGGSRTALPRQQTLRALIDWSYDLLAEDERVLLRRLAVFAGGFTLEAAEKVAGDDREAQTPSPALYAEDILDLLMRLVDKSLVISERQAAAGRARYRLLETIRQYALERLIETGAAEAERVRYRHLEYFVSVAEQAEAMLRGPEQMAWLDRLEQEHDNLRAALEWSLDDEAEAGDGAAEDGLRLAGSLWRFWYLRSARSEGKSWLERTLARSRAVADDPERLAARDAELARARAKALAGVGWLTDDLRREHEAYTESLALCRAAGDRWGEAFALRGLGASEEYEGDPRPAWNLLSESLAGFREIGDTWGEALALFNMGWLPAKMEGDTAKGAELWAQSLNLFRQAGDRWGAAVALSALSGDARIHGNYDRAAELSDESLALFGELGDRAGVASSLNHLALVAYRRGDYRLARELLEKTVALHQETGNVHGLAWGLTILGLVACYQGEYGQAAAALERAEALYGELSDTDDLDLLLAVRGLLLFYQRDEAGAEAAFQRSATLARHGLDRWNLGMALIGLGMLAVRRGEYEQAGEHLQESLSVSREVREIRIEAMALFSLGRLARVRRAFEAARKFYDQSLNLRRDLGAKRGMAETLEDLARLAAAQGGEADTRRAARLFGAAEALRERIGAPLPPVERDEHDDCTATARQALGEAEFDRLWAEGRGLEAGAAVRFALEESADLAD